MFHTANCKSDGSRFGQSPVDVILALRLRDSQLKGLVDLRKISRYVHADGSVPIWRAGFWLNRNCRRRELYILAKKRVGRSRDQDLFDYEFRDTPEHQPLSCSPKNGALFPAHLEVETRPSPALNTSPAKRMVSLGCYCAVKHLAFGKRGGESTGLLICAAYSFMTTRR
jgi:hypothetical protein